MRYAANWGTTRCWAKTATTGWKMIGATTGWQEVRATIRSVAAKALISQDVDVLFSNAQDTPSVIAVAEEAGVYAYNLNSSMKKYAPAKYLGVVGTDWGPHFKRLVDGHVAGAFPGANYWLGMEDDVVFTADWNPEIPADMVAQIEARQAQLTDAIGLLQVDAGGQVKILLVGLKPS